MTVQLLAAAVVRLGDAPVIGREEARRLARDELADPTYDRGQPLLRRILDWLIEQVGRLIESATGALSSGLGVAVLVTLVLAVAVVVVLRAGPMARRARRGADAVFADGRRTAAEYRAAADAAARAGDWNLAVVERYRAIVASLEERGVIEPRSGRTADEAARDAGSVLPQAAAELARGARVFDGVRYGGRAAAADDDATLRELDTVVRAARPQHVATQPPALVAPR